MMSLEKALVLRQYPFLKNDKRLILAEKFSERELYSLSQPLIEEALGVRLARKPSLRKIYPKIIHTQMHLLGLQNIDSLVWGLPSYPALLKEIYDPPFVLFTKGSLSPSRSLAVVGSRNTNSQAIVKTQELGYELAELGVPIISGLAHGIDTAIHEGVMQAKGQAFSVLATSVDDIYPKRNRSLAGTILSYGGGLFSETAPQEVVGRYSFAKRNRIISGLSVGTLVMSASLKSGALITAQCALDQGREVYIWDHPSAGEGAHFFLEQGANPYQKIEDLAPLLGERVKRSKAQILIQQKEARPAFLEVDKKKLKIEDSLINDLMKELGI